MGTVDSSFFNTRLKVIVPTLLKEKKKKKKKSREHFKHTSNLDEQIIHVENVC